MEEEASGGGRGRVLAGPPAASSPVPARKAVRMSDVRDFIIPSFATSDFAVAEGSAAAGSSVSMEPTAAARGLDRHATGATTSPSSSPGGGVPCEGALQDTPDYIRRGAARHRVAPLELFSAATSPPTDGRAAAKEVASSEECRGVSSANARADGASETETVGGGGRSDQAILPAEEGESGCCGQLKQQYGLLLREKEECRRLLEDLMRENVLKTRECREAQESLRDLQMELMRKSMHVGSLASAVEGQVKEKSRLCQFINELSEKFKVLKLEHQNLRQESLEYKNCVLDATQMSTTIQQYAVNQYATLEREFKDLKEKFSEEAKERKDLYNKLIELKGNIRVFCRCRPLNAEEIAEGASTAIDFESAKDGELIVKGHVSSKKVFKFDSVFSPEEDQERVFEKTAPFATSVLDGFNVCIFAYGQTGTGKTFTMEGVEGARGVNYRTLEELFRIIKEREGIFLYDVTVSVLEVYNEQIHDLLLTGSQPGTTSKRLEVKQVAEGVHHVPGLVEARVTNMNEAWEVLQTGSKARVVGSTNANEHSSRSHCIHCVMVKGENMINGECTKSKLWLIDLAGSERVAKTDAQGERLREAQNINKSLSALGDVISALATKTPHIPFRHMIVVLNYRNSKLTHLLQDSLSIVSNAGGDSKTLMFVQISPNENDVGETLCSLNFASRVRGIELGQARKQVDVGELSRYKLMVGRAKQESKNKDVQIKSMEETIQSLEAKNKAKDLLTMNLQEKIKELESQLLVERKIARQHVDNKIAQDHLQKQHSMKEERSYLRSPMTERNLNSTAEKPPAAPKDFGMAKQMFSDSNTDTYSFNQLMSLGEEKENNPEAGQLPLTTKVRRVSLCNGGAYLQPMNQASRRQSLIPLPRRNSLMPLPTAKPAAAAPPPPLDKITENLSSPPLCSPPVVSNDKGSRSKRINSILRRSLQKKVIIRPSMVTQAGRKASATAAAQGIDGARKAARRVPMSGSGGQRVQQNRDKERGWNNGTCLRNNF
ncbi:Kinesin-like protein KIFC3 [Dichanthelium oligosanthes]|uniref:Kinesin-like protein KIFC3 n=1 Tax=Dichanthelium oligosanthes TaxID=888268 RepID=A0A1E5WMH8_9POAL|nr:Kinesin-like protein KIFC3 [Dichanthelium oligosanthes]